MKHAALAEEETKKFTYAKTDDILSCSVSNAEQTLCSAS